MWKLDRNTIMSLREQHIELGRLDELAQQRRQVISVGQGEQFASK